MAQEMSETNRLGTVVKTRKIVEAHQIIRGNRGIAANIFLAVQELDHLRHLDMIVAIQIVIVTALLILVIHQVRGDKRDLPARSVDIGIFVEKENEESFN